MNRVFADLKRIRKLLEEERQFFAIGIKNNWTVELGDNGQDLVGKNERSTQG